MKEKEFGAEELYLAPETEIFATAKRIAVTSIKKDKYSFVIKYDINQKDFLLSVLSQMGCLIEKNIYCENKMIVLMNVEQLRMIKEFDCIEEVQEDNETLEQVFDKNDFSILTSNQKNDIINETSSDVYKITNKELSYSSVANPASFSRQEDNSFCCDYASHNTMENALPINPETMYRGNICCPGCEIWYRFSANANNVYTIFTSGVLDTVGILYNSQGKPIACNDDYNGKMNFRIEASLIAGETYYVCVKAFHNNVGSFNFKVTEKTLVSSVYLNHKNVTMDVGETAQLTTQVYPSSANEKRVFYISLDKSVATVDYHSGLVTAKKHGTATIYVYDWDMLSRGAKCTVTVCCGGVNYKDASYHTFESQSDGYYVCSKCGYKIKSPALQDKHVLNKSDYLLIGSLYHEYLTVIEEYPIYAKKILALIDAIRGLPENRYKYEYCDLNGKYIPEYCEEFGNFDIWMTVDKGRCLSEWILLNSMFSIIGAFTPPPYSLMISIVAPILLAEHPGAEELSGAEIFKEYALYLFETRKIMPKEVLNAILVYNTFDSIVNGTTCTKECYNINITLCSKEAPYDCYQINYHFSDGIETMARGSLYKVDGLKSVEPSVDYRDIVNNREYHIYG